jgi:hypothetical protein
MSLVNISGVLDSFNSLVGTIFGSKLQRDDAAADENVAAKQEFGNEFRLANRTWFDSMMDGVNRLPRPIMVFSVFYMFFMAYRNPGQFAIVMQALAIIPEQMWDLLYIIIGFYLPSRMIEKIKMGKGIDQKTVNMLNYQAGEVTRMKEAREAKTIDDLPWLRDNRAVEAWKAKTSNGQ